MTNEIVYEKRFGPRNQIEIAVPFGWRERTAVDASGWAGGIGAQEMGYAAYFFLTFWLSFPAYLLLARVRRMLEQQERQEV